MNDSRSSILKDLDALEDQTDSIEDNRIANKRTGSFYTPWDLAYDITSRSLAAALFDSTGIDVQRRSYADLDVHLRDSALGILRSMRILDPAVGEGVFLLASAEWLLRTRKAFGDRSGEDALRQDILSNNLYGVDLVENAVDQCKNALKRWARCDDSQELAPSNIREGNSLVGWVSHRSMTKVENDALPNEALWESLGSKYSQLRKSTLTSMKPFHWEVEFPEVITGDEQGFDIIIGNPPYGNILSDVERHLISKTHNFDISTGRTGTWNSASLFIARSRALLKEGGHLGFLVPNSVLRTKQFSKVRQLLLTEMQLWLVIDEASPFDDVTLEMVSLFCRAGHSPGDYEVQVLSRRPGIDWEGQVPGTILESSNIFPLYYDSTLAIVLKRATKGWVTASRGRDIPKAHVNKTRSQEFKVPYATSGRSVKRYRLDPRYLIYSDMAFREDQGLLDSYENMFLISTKNYPYPRCVMKPRGVIHGGGAVRIKALKQGVDYEALGLILNSRLIRYLCVKYLTNYSQLTTCLNTGIMEELPLVFPTDTMPFSTIFRAMGMLHENPDDDSNAGLASYLDRVADTLVYELFLLNRDSFFNKIEARLEKLGDSWSPQEVCRLLKGSEVSNLMDEILKTPIVEVVENSHRMSP
ncbi:MAG: Eco57I restriction-modification methylase domain-containing protein [Candidatus Thorarchaeota archaeon]